MNKKVLYTGITTIAITAGASAFFVFHSYFLPKTETSTSCPFEIKQCPDGSAVSRVGADCEFALCPNSIAQPSATAPQEIEKPSPFSEATTTNPRTSPARVSPPNEPSQQPKLASEVPTTLPKNNPTPSISQAVSSFISSSVATISSTISNVVSVISSQTSSLDEEKYSVQNGNIVSSNNTIIYSLPANIISEISGTSTTTESHTVNAIPVGNVAPILNAIPIVGLPGKYYLSENSFGNPEDCIFSNKIFILDTKTNEVTLMYEENNTTLTRDDPRACNSEIFLLATEEEKLIIKYHTIGTNSLCDSAWSEPEKTWYLDVTQLPLGMRRFGIPETLYNNAEQQESTCRETVGQ